MKKVLGKGLSALIPDNYIDELKSKIPAKEYSPEVTAKTEQASGFMKIPIGAIRPNRDQPRKEFSEEAIKELADSIKEKGILQPMVVKKVAENEYELICGERRLRAATMCGLGEVPVVIKDIASDEFLEWALIENIQREDLNPLEEAEAYRKLAEERMLSHDDVAKKVGKDRSTVTNALRLLRLPEDVRIFLSDGRLSTGHARALLGLLTPEHQRQMARRIVEENLSVRQVESIVNRSNAHKRKAKYARHLSPEILDLENRLAQHLGTQVRIFPKKSKSQGRLEMHYFSLDDLDRMLERMGLPKV